MGTKLRYAAPVAVFALVLGIVVAVSRHGSSPGKPHRLPLASTGGTGRETDAKAGAPAAAPVFYGGEIHVSDALLAGLPDHGPSYDLKASGTDRVEALAKALGISGAVHEGDGSWTVGTGDRTLTVSTTYGQSWYLGYGKGVVSSGSGSTGSGGVAVATVTAAPPPSPATSPATSPGSEPSSEPADTPLVTCAPDQKCGPLAEPTKPPQPSDDVARGVLAKVLDAIGRDPGTVTLEEGWSGKDVTSAPVVDGLQTVGFETRLSVAADGTAVYGSGFLTDARLDATYPLLGVRDAVKRGGSGIYAARDIALAPYPSPTGTPAPREATKVRLGLMFAPSYETDGQGFLVPAWLLSFADTTFETPFLALPDEYVATPPAPSYGTGGGTDGGAVPPGVPETAPAEVKPS
jgi:hypothetical protein